MIDIEVAYPESATVTLTDQEVEPESSLPVYREVPWNDKDVKLQCFHWLTRRWRRVVNPQVYGQT